MNRPVRFGALLLLLAGVLLAAGCRVGNVVAVVNGVELTADDLEREMRHARAYYKNQEGIDLDLPENAAQLKQVEAASLERIIYQELVRQIAEGFFPPAAAGQTPTVIRISDAEVDAAVQQILAQAQSSGTQDLDQLLKVNGFADEAEFREFVRGNLRVQKLVEIYGLAEQVHVRHILVETEEEARQVLKRLQGGEDFSAVAKEVSMDPGSAAKGGDLGWFGRGRMVAEFEEAAFSLEVGQLSQPVQTRYGFHILQLLEKAMRPDDQAFQNWFLQMEAQAQIERK